MLMAQDSKSLFLVRLYVVSCGSALLGSAWLHAAEPRLKEQPPSGACLMVEGKLKSLSFSVNLPWTCLPGYHWPKQASLQPEVHRAGQCTPPTGSHDVLSHDRTVSA